MEEYVSCVYAIVYETELSTQEIETIMGVKSMGVTPRKSNAKFRWKWWVQSPYLASDNVTSSLEHFTVNILPKLSDGFKRLLDDHIAKVEIHWVIGTGGDNPPSLIIPHSTMTRLSSLDVEFGVYVENQVSKAIIDNEGT